MKKFRGKKRYFRNLSRASTAEQYNLNYGKDGWFDLWHTHLDFYGVGNQSLKLRREHIKANLALYNGMLEKLKAYEKPFQAWILLEEKYAEYDAVFLHISNPNEENFPLKLEDLEWICTEPDWLKGLINLNEFNVGRYIGGSNSCYIIQSKNQGIKL